MSAPELPTKEGYTFLYWQKGDVEFDFTTIITEDITLVAKWKINEYTVTFKNWDGSILEEKQIEYGKMPTYTGVTPVKLADKTYTYTFATWDKEINPVTGNVEYIAQYDKEYIEYTVTFKLENGEADFVRTYHYGDEVVIPENPIKPSDGIYTYTFTGWHAEETNVDENVVYIALYDKEYIEYTVTFKLENGEEDIVRTYHYGDIVEVPANPSKASDKTYTYKFADWDKEIVVVESDATYTAKYDATYIDYVVTFVLGNGQADVVTTYHYGDKIEAPANPSKDADKIYKYTFTGWDKEVDTVEGHTTYTAMYKQEYVEYTITFRFGNGEADFVKTYHYGDIVEVPANPNKDANETFTYTFKDWGKEVVPVDSDATYIAQYTREYVNYTITFVLGNGEEDIVLTYHYGDTVAVPSDPTKAATVEYTYKFADWDKEITKVRGNATYTATYTATKNKYTITFINWDGSILEEKQVEYGVVPTYTKSTPTKTADKTYTYAFADWDEEVVAVAGNATYTAQYDATYIDYVITFVLGNGEEDVVKVYHYGDKIEAPTNPSKAADKTYTYTFAGWDKTVNKVEGNTTYTAKYDATYIDYVITFVLGNGQANVVKTYHYGDRIEAPTDPSKASDKTYTYTFAGWDKTVDKVEGNTTYTAKYDATYIDYVITFVLGNGQENIVKTYHYGDIVEVPADPSKASDKTYTYKFADWDKEVVTVESDATYTAKYDATYIDYVVRFVLGNGEADIVRTYHYGDIVEVPANPSKAADKTYTYKFADWDKTVVAVESDATYTAKYDATYIDYVVRFVLGNGEADVVKTYHYGDKIEAPADPSKTATAEYTYTFATWDKTVDKVEGDITFTAKYKVTKNKYTVTFLNWDGSVLEEKQVEYGVIPAYTKATPTKESDKTYTYEFATWDKDPVAVTGDVTYTAQYDATYIDYVITFVLENGEENVVKTYHYGDKIEAPTDPSKASDKTYTYEFAGWDKTVDKVEGNTTYTAQYDAKYIDYVVTFVLGNGEADVVKTYHYGDIVEVPANPSKAADKIFKYTFTGWDNAIDKVEGNATYTAMYKQEYVEYTITFRFGNGEKDFVKTYHYGDIVEVPEDPSKAANETFTYTFKDWGKQVVPVESDATYIAQYTREYVNYTVRFVLGNGEEDIVLTYHYGDTVQVPAKPSKASDKTYTYEFTDWDKEITKVRGNVTYTAQYDATYIDYVVRFVLGNGEADVVKTYHYGDKIEAPADPSKASDKTYTYTFATWDKTVDKVEGNITFTAKYDAKYIDYVITFVLGNGEANIVKTYHYGDKIEAPTDPSKASDKTYTYAFAGWDKAVDTVEGNTTYTAQYDATYIDYAVTFVLGNGQANVVKTYHYGDKIEAPRDPSKASDKTYTYTFTGWDKAVDKVEGNTTYTAQYDATYIDYVVTFVLGNGEADVVKTYHYGDTVEVPTKPIKAADKTYTYTFKDWDKEVVAVESDTTYTAQYDATYIDYTIRFVLGNGEADIVKTYHYGNKIEAPADPSKTATAEYTYTFAGWDKAVDTVEGNTTYTAKYTATKNKYTITFLNWDGSILEEKQVEYGVVPTYTKVTPTKIADNTYTYEFADWDKALVAVTGDMTYTAQYDKTYIEYTITFVLGNGEEDIVKTYHYGDEVVVPADPSKAANETFTYTFKDWGKEVVLVEADATYIAQYTREYVNYTVTFVLGNGEEDIVLTYHYGDTVEVPAKPSKAADDTYTYEFTDWDKEITKVRGNVTYTAMYEATYIDYVVRFVLGNGEEDIVRTYHYGDEVVAPKDPSKPSTLIHKYTFTGWDKDIDKVTGHTTYTALYKQEYIDYVVTFVLGNGEANIVKTYHYGDKIEAPAGPSKAADKTYTYTFAGWDKTVDIVEGNTTFTAKYDAKYIDYVITFVLGNGQANVVKTYHYGDKIVAPADPSKAATAEYTYTFAGWDKTVDTVEGNTTFTAKYTATKNKYTVTFLNWDGSILEEKQVEYGVIPTYTKATPTKQGNEVYKYTFTGWNKEPVAVTGTATYTAQFKQDYVDYTVTFVLGNGEENVVKTYHYGDTVDVPANPSKAADKTYTYKFSNWDKAVVPVAGDVTYTAQYDATYIDYVVTFVLGNGQANVVKTYHYGDKIEAPADPSKAATAEYTYTFAGWDKAVDTVEGNTTYTAQYTATKNKYTVNIYDSNGMLLKTEIAEYGTQLKDLVALTEEGTWVEEYQGHKLTDIITGNTDLVVVETAEIREINNILTTELDNVNNRNMTASFHEEEDLISVDFKNSGKAVSAMLNDVVGILETISNSDDSYASIVLSYPGATDLDLKQLVYSDLDYLDFIWKTDSATNLSRFIARVGKNSGSGSHALGVTTTELATRTAATPIHVTVTLKDGYVNEDGSNTIEYDLIFTVPSE